jgi:hypothetical protein
MTKEEKEAQTFRVKEALKMSIHKLMRNFEFSGEPGRLLTEMEKVNVLGEIIYNKTLG